MPELAQTQAEIEVKQSLNWLVWANLEPKFACNSIGEAVHLLVLPIRGLMFEPLIPIQGTSYASPVMFLLGLKRRAGWWRMRA